MESVQKLWTGLQFKWGQIEYEDAEVFTDNQWLGAMMYQNFKFSKQLTPQRAAFGENVYQTSTQCPIFNHTQFQFSEQTLHHPTHDPSLGNGVLTNMGHTVDRTSKHD
jgi:hypothetical protein